MRLFPADQDGRLCGIDVCFWVYEPEHRLTVLAPGSPNSRGWSSVGAAGLSDAGRAARKRVVAGKLVRRSVEVDLRLRGMGEPPVAPSDLDVSSDRRRAVAVDLFVGRDPVDLWLAGASRRYLEVAGT